MKKMFAYIVSAVAMFAMCWCGLLCIATPPGNERLPFAIGACVGFFISLLCAGAGNSLKWDGTKSDEDSE